MSSTRGSDQARKRTWRKTDAAQSVRAIGYTRVSTDEQLQGGGLEIQEQAIRRHCEDLGFRLVNLISDEGASGGAGLEQRIGLTSALARIEDHDADCLVVYRLDRLARDFVLQELLVMRLRERGTPIHSVTEPDIETDTDDPTKILVRQVLGAIAQYERALIRGRMQAGKVLKAAKGGYVGGQPRYGTRAADAELVADEREAQVVQHILSLRQDGLSYRRICDALRAAGYKPRRASDWHPMVIRSIVAASHDGG